MIPIKILIVLKIALTRNGLKQSRLRYELTNVFSVVAVPRGKTNRSGELEIAGLKELHANRFENLEESLAPFVGFQGTD